MPTTPSNNHSTHISAPPTSYQFTFLGTGTSVGIPMIGCVCNVCQSEDKRDKRLRTSALFSINNTNICIDSGPDFRTQMLNAGINNLHAIIYTHAHQDHIAGLDDIRAFNVWQQKPIDIYMESMVHQTLSRQYPYIFEADNKYPGAPEVSPYIISPGHTFYIHNIPVIPLRIMHGNLPIVGFRIYNLTYITDAKYIPDDSIAQIQGSEILIINALRPNNHWSHFTLSEAIDFAQKIGAKQTYLTHLSHQIGQHAYLENILPPNIFVAYDGLKINVPISV